LKPVLLKCHSEQTHLLPSLSVEQLQSWRVYHKYYRIKAADLFKAAQPCGFAPLTTAVADLVKACTAFDTALDVAMTAAKQKEVQHLQLGVQTTTLVE